MAGPTKPFVFPGEIAPPAEPLAPSETGASVPPPSSAEVSVSEARPRPPAPVDVTTEKPDPIQPGVIGKEDYFQVPVNDLPDFLTADELGDVPYFRVEKAETGLFGFGEGESGKHMGKLAVDKASLRTNLAEARLQTALVHFSADTGREPTPEELERITTSVEETAREHIDKFEMHRRNQDSNELWVDMDPNDYALWAKKKAESGLIGRLTAPLAANWHGIDVAYSDGAPESASYNEGDLMGNLDWIGRQSLWTMMSTAALASGKIKKAEDMSAVDVAKAASPLALLDIPGVFGAWGSEEHLELLSQGHDLFSLAEELGFKSAAKASYVPKALAAADFIFGAEEDTYAALGGQAMAFGMSVLDPDILMFASIPKAVVKGVRNVGEITGVAARFGYSPKAIATAKAGHATEGRAILKRNAGEQHEAVGDIERTGVPEMAGQGRKATTRVHARWAEDAVREVRDYFKALGPDGDNQFLGVIRNAQARIGSSMPVGRKTRHATEAAARARKTLQDMLEGATDAALKATDDVAAARAGAKRSNATPVGDAVAAQGMKIAQLDHMSAAMALQDMKTHRGAIRRLGQFTSPTIKPTAAQEAVLKGDMVKGLTDLKTARDAMMASTTLQTVEAFQDATKAFEGARKAALGAMGGATEEAVDQMVTLMQKHVDGLADTANAAYRDMRKRRKGALRKPADASWKAHQKQLQDMAGSSAKLREDREIFAALDSTLADMAKGYKAMASGDEAEEMLTLSRQTERIIQGGIDASGGQGWNLRSMQRMAFNVYDPMVSMFGVGPRVVQETLSDGLAIPQLAERELRRLVKGLEEAAAKNIIAKYVTNLEMPASVINSLGGRTLWSHALPTLRAQMARRGTSRGGGDQAFETLARAFIPSGSDAAQFKRVEGGVYKALEKALSAPNPTFDDITEAVETATRATGLPADSSSRAVAYAAQAVINAATMNIVGQRLAKKVARVTPEQAVKMENMLDPGFVGEDYLRLMKVFEKMGMDHHLSKRINALGKETSAGVMALVDDFSGEAAFIPWSFVDAMETRWGHIVKATDPYKQANPNAAAHIMKDTVSKMGRLYSASLVTGLVFPRIRHFANIFVGNFAQTWADDDLLTALNSSGSQITMETMNMGAYIPGVKVFAERRRAAMQAKLGTTNVLPSMLNAVNNPAVAFIFDSKIMKHNQKIATPTGHTTAGALRQQMAELGVMSSFVGSTGLRDILRTNNSVMAAEGWLKKNLKGTAAWMAERHAVYADVADAVEQRQRAAYFIDLVTRKGLSPEEAARKVKDALYDWNSPMSSFESDYISKVLMFWGFQRRALGQAGRLLLEPLTDAPDISSMDSLFKAVGKGAVETSTGASWLAGKKANSWAKLKDQQRAQHAVKEAMRSEAEGDEDLKRVYPWWSAKAGSKAFLWNGEISEEEKEARLKYTGRKDTYRSVTMPAFTPLEMTGFWFHFAESMLAGINDDPYIVGGATKAVGNNLMEFLKDSGGPVTKEAFRGISEAYFEGGDRYETKSRKVHKMTDKFFLSRLPYFSEGTHPDTEDPGALRIDPGKMALWQFITPLSYELGQWTEPFAEGMLIKQSKEEALRHMAAQYTGIFQPYTHSPEKTLGYDQKAVKKEVSKQISDTKKRRGVAE